MLVAHVALAEHLYGDVEIGLPGRVRSDRDLKCDPGLVQRARLGGRDGGPSLIGIASVCEDEHVLFDVPVVGALLLQRVFDLEEIREVAIGLDPDREVDRRSIVIEDRKPLVEAVADRTLADHRQLRVHVDAPDTGHKEEPRLEVLEVVGRQGGEPVAVHSQHPLRKETGVEREQSRRVGERRFDVAARIADDERVAVEDRDEAAVHEPPRGSPGKRR